MDIVNIEIMKRKKASEGELNVLLEAIIKEKQVIIEQKNATDKEIRSVIGDEEEISANKRNIAKRRLDLTQAEFDNYKKDLDILTILIENRNEIIDEIKDNNKLIFATRDAEISKIVEKISIIKKEDFNIELKLIQSGDKNEFSKILSGNKEKILHGKYAYRKIPEIIVSKFNPFSFVDAILSNDPEKLIHEIDIESEAYEINSEYANKLIEESIPYNELDELKVRQYDRGKLLKLFLIQEVPFDDKFFIKLNNKPIQYCSPGQRCSAMLPIVTLTSDAPLIIDQPEDNLDNRLVSQTVFKILVKLKEQRQIILATHNPNILVSGDAEQVIVLDSDGTVKDCGSIDKPSIVENVIDLMEGGKEAFDKRQKKYRPILNSS